MDDKKVKKMDIINAHDYAQDAGAGIPIDDVENKELMKKHFPPNSRAAKNQEKRVNKVITGKVVSKKKSLSKRFFETFVGEDVADVKGYVIHDVLVPAIKATFSDMVQGGIEMLLFGDRSRGNRTRRDGGRSYVSYNNYSSGRKDYGRDRGAANRARHNFDDIVLESRGEGEEVLSNLVDLIEEYGQATVADMYDLVGMTGNFTDNKWGWTNLASASVDRVRDGYVVNLPRPISLD